MLGRKGEEEKGAKLNEKEQTLKGKKIRKMFHVRHGRRDRQSAMSKAANGSNEGRLRVNHYVLQQEDHWEP